MQFIKIFTVSLCVLQGITLMLLCAKYEKSFKYLLLNIILGIAALAAIDLTARFSGIHIPINPYSAATSALFGMPGVCGMLVMNLI